MQKNKNIKIKSLKTYNKPEKNKAKKCTKKTRKKQTSEHAKTVQQIIKPKNVQKTKR